MTRFFVDASGAYIGGFFGAVPPAGAVEVPSAPPSAAHVWLGGVWALPASAITAADSDTAKAELVALDLASIRPIREYIASKADAPQILKDREALAIAARARVKP